MRRHFVQLVEIAVGIHVAETRPDGLVDEKQIGELIPRAWVVLQGVIVLESVRANLHQRSIHRATARPSIQPNDGALSVRDMPILIMPKEEVAIAYGVHLDVTVNHLCVSSAPVRSHSHPAKRMRLTQHAFSEEGRPVLPAANGHSNPQPSWRPPGPDPGLRRVSMTTWSKPHVSSSEREKAWKISQRLSEV